jgi:exosortase
MDDVTSDSRKPLANILILGVLLAALAASFYGAWWWSSRSWFSLRPFAGGSNPAYSPGPLIPVMVFLMFSTHLRRLKPTPGIARQDLFLAAFQRLLLPVMIAVAKGWNSLVRGVQKGPAELRADAWKYRLVGVWVAWGILAGLLALTLPYSQHAGAGVQHMTMELSGLALLFVHVIVFSAAVLYVGWRTYHADEKGHARGQGISSQIVGLGLLVFFLLFHFVAIRGDMPRLSVMAFLGCIIALVWYFYGWRAARVVIFPLAFMIFMLPMEWVEDKFGLPAQIFATKHSVAIMRFLGLKVQATGMTAMSILRQSGPIDFNVAAPCSGLKSLVALTAISATYGYVTQKSLGKMLAIMACGPLIAIVSNIIRLVAVGVAAQFWGRGPAMTVHDHALPIYILGILLLMAIDKLINSKWLKIEDF